jgi:hypothetical protein
MRQSAIALCCVLAAGRLLPGQQQTPPAFKGGVALVTVDVTVLDRDGRPVPGLTAADFQVKLNGRVQPVRALTYLEAGAATAEDSGKPAAPVMPQLFPVAPVAEVAPTVSEARVFVILVDDLSFSPLAGRGLFSAAQRFVEGLPASDLVGFSTSSGPGAVNPTRDRAPIVAALKSVVGEWTDPRAIDRGGSASGNPAGASPDQSVGIGQALDIDRGDISALTEAIARECFNGERGIFNGKSLEQVLAESHCASQLQIQARRTAAQTRQTTDRQVRAFQSVITAMKPATGIKHLLLVTGGVGVTFDVSSLAPVGRAAAEAGVQLSVMMEEPGMSMTDQGRRDLGPGTIAKPQADTGMSARRREDDAMFISGAHTLADIVGGAFYRVIGSPDPFFQRVLVASSAVYRLAVEAPANSEPGRDFAMVATVRRPGLSALTNKRAIVTVPSAGAAASPAAAPAAAPASKGIATVDDQLRAAMTAGRAFDGVPISLVSGVRRAAEPGQMEIGIRVRVPASAKGPLTAAFGVVDEAGKLRSGRRVIDSPPEGESYQVTFSVPVAPGAYQLRFAVADASGRVGALSKTVRAQLVTMGPIAAGDLQTSWSDANEQEQSVFPSPEVIPAAAKTLNASLELFQIAGSPAPADVLIKLAFGPAGQPPAIERIVSPANASGVWRAEAQFPLDRVAAGACEILATVLVDGKVVGTTTATVTKR